MHLSQILVSYAALVTFAAADFHIVASNAADDQHTIVEMTEIFVIGSSDDTPDNKCSSLNTGSFSVPALNVAQFGEDDHCTSGLCLLQGKSFSFDTKFCGLDGANFQKMNDTSYLFFDSNNKKLGRCLATTQTQETCKGKDGNVSGDIDDLFFCQVDNNPGFCDPVVG